MQQDQQVIHKLKCISIISLMFMTVQILGGIMANSVAILADAFHLLSDVLAYVISLQAVLMSHRQSPFFMTFGYQKVQPLGALINVTIIWFVTIELLIEATERIVTRSVVEDPLYMLLTSFFGLGCNLYIMKVLHSDTEHGGHHGCSHSHGDQQHGHQSKAVHSHDGKPCSHGHAHEQKKNAGGKCGHSHKQGNGHEHGDHHHKQEHEHDHSHEHGHSHDQQHKHSQCGHSHEKDHSHHEHSHEQQDHKDGCCGSDHSMQSLPSKQILSQHEHQHDFSHEFGHPMSEQIQEFQQNLSAEHLHVATPFSQNINIQAAYIHIITDIILSIGVIFSALIIYFMANPHEWSYWQLADPLCTYLFSVMAIYSTIGIVKDSAIILLDGCDDREMLADVTKELDSIKGIAKYHKLKVWALNRGKHVAAVNVVPGEGVDAEALRQRVRGVFVRRSIECYVEVGQVEEEKQALAAQGHHH